MKKPESKKKLIAEHKRLVEVLRSPSHEDDKKEAKIQTKELKEYQSEEAEKSNSAIGRKISKLVHEGKPQKQAEAIALQMQRSGRLTPSGGYRRVKKSKVTPKEFAILHKMLKSG